MALQRELRGQGGWGLAEGRKACARLSGFPLAHAYDLGMKRENAEDCAKLRERILVSSAGRGETGARLFPRCLFASQRRAEAGCQSHVKCCVHFQPQICTCMGE